jgi:TolB-like protein
VSFVEELKRRRVFRVGGAYLVGGWVVLQVADLVLENVAAPAWVMQVLLLLVGLGLPVALLLAWAFAWTPQGLRREREVRGATPGATPVRAPHAGEISHQGTTASHRAQVALLLVVGVLLGVAGVAAWTMASGDSPAGEAGSDVSTASTLADSTAADRSLAVLPFADLSPDGDFAWFADGLSEEIINAITRAPDIQVASRTSSFAFRGDSVPVPEIASRLNVGHVLEGSVRRSNATLRVTAQLIRADGFHAWSRNYDGQMDDAIAIQTSLAEDIATVLETSLDPEALADMAEVGTRSVPAYLDYLHGLSLRQQFLDSGGDSLPQLAARFFDAARRADPGFWAAHMNAALQWAQELDLSRIGGRATGLPADRILAEYRSRLRDATDAAGSEAERLRADGLESLSEGRLMDAVASLRRYVELRPTDVQALDELAALYHSTNRNAEVGPTMQQIRSLAERSDRAALSYVERAWRNGTADGSAYGLELARRWSSRTFLYQLHRMLLWDGRVDDARGILARLQAVAPGWGLTLIPRARQACAEGDRTAAEQALADDASNPGTILDASSRWHMRMLLGQTRQAHEELRAAGEPIGVVQWIPFLDYPQFDPSYFPELEAMLEREGIDRPPPTPSPWACPATTD